MARKDYKINESIRVLYRAIAGSTSVNMDVYDETDTLDVAQSGAMTQLGASDRWVKDFTPDANGNWSVNCSDNNGGSVPKDYSIGDYNIDSVGAGVATVESKVDALNDISSSDVATELSVYDAPTKAELDTAEGNIRGGSETLETLKTKIEALPQASPPLIG